MLPKKWWNKWRCLWVIFSIVILIWEIRNSSEKNKHRWLLKNSTITRQVVLDMGVYVNEFEQS